MSRTMLAAQALVVSKCWSSPFLLSADFSYDHPAAGFFKNMPANLLLRHIGRSEVFAPAVDATFRSTAPLAESECITLIDQKSTAN